MTSDVHIFVYGNEMQGMSGRRILESFEAQRSPAEARGILYAGSAAFPVAVFDESVESTVIGELVQVKPDAISAALNRLAISHDYKEGDPRNLFDSMRIKVRFFGGEEIDGVHVFAAPKSFDPDGAERIEGGDWRAYRRQITTSPRSARTASQLADLTSAG